MSGLLRALMSNEKEAIARREALTEWKPLSLAQVFSVESPPSRPVRVFADGVYDLFHHGHAEQLRQAKNLLPNTYLIVGVCADKDVQTYKGTRAVLTEEERCTMVGHCKYVDEVCLAPPYFTTVEFVDELKADFVAHDSIPYTAIESPDCYAPFKKAGRFLTTERTPSVSTTELVTRILKNYRISKKREEISVCANESVNDGIRMRIENYAE